MLGTYNPTNGVLQIFVCESCGATSLHPSPVATSAVELVA